MPDQPCTATGDVVVSSRPWVRAAQRPALTDLAESRGLTVGGLSRRTKILVAADPDSLSGTAEKARAYGVPIVNEQGLLSYLLTMS